MSILRSDTGNMWYDWFIVCPIYVSKYVIYYFYILIYIYIYVCVYYICLVGRRWKCDLQMPFHLSLQRILSDELKQLLCSCLAGEGSGLPLWIGSGLAHAALELLGLSCGDGSKPWYLVNPKIAGIMDVHPTKNVSIGIDPYPCHIQIPNFMPQQFPTILRQVAETYFTPHQL